MDGIIFQLKAQSKTETDFSQNTLKKWIIFQYWPTKAKPTFFHHDTTAEFPGWEALQKAEVRLPS